MFATPASTPRAGVTLLELLLVMAVIGLVLGAGVGVISTLDVQSDRAALVVRGALRAAQSTARTEQQPAWVAAEEDGSRLVVGVPRAVYSGGFGGPLEGGARGVTPTPIGARLVDEGYLGGSVALTDGGLDARVEIALDLLGGLDLTEGFALRVHVRPSDLDGGRIVGLGEWVGLDARADGVVLGFVQPDGAQRVDVRSDRGALAAGRWTELGLVYDRARLRLLVDGFPVGIVEVTQRLGVLTEPVVLGGRPRPFPGLVDELVLWSYERSEPIALPETVAWPSDAPAVVRFGPDGALDPLAHEGEVRIPLTYPDGTTQAVRVGRHGIVE